MQAIGQHEVLEVALPPVVVEAAVSVLALGIDPHVERLGHDHHSQRIAYIHLHLRRHIMSSTNGITPHRLEEFDLTDECRLIDSSTNHTQIVMQTDSAEFTRDAIQLEPILRTI